MLQCCCKAGVCEVNEIELAACKTLASILRTHLSALPPEQSDIEHEVWLVGSVWVAVDVLEPLILSSSHIARPFGHVRRNRPATLLAVLYLQRILRWPSLVDVGQLRGNDQPSHASREHRRYAVAAEDGLLETCAQSTSESGGPIILRKIRMHGGRPKIVVPSPRTHEYGSFRSFVASILLPYRAPVVLIT